MTTDVPVDDASDVVTMDLAGASAVTVKVAGSVAV